MTTHAATAARVLRVADRAGVDSPLLDLARVALDRGAGDQALVLATLWAAAVHGDEADLAARCGEWLEEQSRGAVPAGRGRDEP